MTESKNRHLIRIPGKGYFVSKIRGKIVFTYDERKAWSTDFTTEGWKVAHEICEELRIIEAYVCERLVRY